MIFKATVSNKAHPEFGQATGIRAIEVSYPESLLKKEPW